MSGEGLKKTLGPVMLWGLGVGYVISGEYFGWNLGLRTGGSYGMLIATLLVTLMYVSFIFSYTELSCAIPRAGGAFVYCSRAFGPLGGALGGLAHRWGYLPRVVGHVHVDTGTPRMALVVNLLLGTIAILTGRTSEIITLACFGALSLYVLSMAALLRLRRTEPGLPRPFKAVGFPYLAYVALALALVCLLALTWTQPKIAGVFAVLMGLGLAYYRFAGSGTLDGA